MPPTRFSARAYRAKLASQSQSHSHAHDGADQLIPIARRGPTSTKKSVRASAQDHLKYASFEVSSRQFTALKRQLHHLEHLPWDFLEFNEHTAVDDRVAAACAFRGVDDALLHPQLFITATNQKVRIHIPSYSISSMKTRTDGIFIFILMVDRPLPCMLRRL